MKKKLSNVTKFIMFFIGTTILLLSCQNSQDVEFYEQQGNTLDEHKDYTGEELFKGIYFLTGDFASKLPMVSASVQSVQEIRETQPQAARMADEFMEDLIANIKEIDPDYFENLKFQLLSDDLFLISDAIASGKEIIRAAGYKSKKYQDAFKLADDISQAKINYGSEKIKNLDLNNTKDAKKYAEILQEDYKIDLGKYSETQECIAVVLVVIAIAVAAALVTVVNTAVGVNLYYSYNVTETTGLMAEEDALAFQQAYSKQISEVLRN